MTYKSRKMQIERRTDCYDTKSNFPHKMAIREGKRTTVEGKEESTRNDEQSTEVKPSKIRTCFGYNAGMRKPNSNRQSISVRTTTMRKHKGRVYMQEQHVCEKFFDNNGVSTCKNRTTGKDNMCNKLVEKKQSDKGRTRRCNVPHDSHVLGACTHDVEARPDIEYVRVLFMQFLQLHISLLLQFTRLCVHSLSMFPFLRTDAASCDPV